MTTIQIKLYNTKTTDYGDYSIAWKDEELDSFTVNYNTDNTNRAIAFAKRKIKAIRKANKEIKAWSYKVI